MDNKAKKRVGIISFLPFIAWCLPFTYFMIVNRPLIHTATFQDHEKVTTLVSQHFYPLLALLIVATLVTAGVIYYYVIHLARLKNMGPGAKIAWIIFLIAFGAVAFPVIWYFEIRREPVNVETYPDIA